MISSNHHIILSSHQNPLKELDQTYRLMPKPTGGFLTVKPLEYVEESEYGVFPSNPSMQWIGVVQNISQTLDVGAEEIEAQREDLYRIVRGSEKV